MKNLLDELEKYEHYKFNYSLSYTKKLINNEGFVSKIVEIANKKISQNIVNERDKFTMYAFVFKKESLYKKPIKIIYNTFLSKAFKNPKMDFIEKIIREIDTNKNLKISDFEVNFYIFPIEKKKESEKFYKLFQMFRDSEDKIEDQYKKTYFTSPIGSFLTDSYNVFAKHYISITAILLLISFYHLKLQLFMLGIPNDIITDTKILSVLKLFTIAFLPTIGFIVIIFIIYIYSLSKFLIKDDLYNILKGITALVIYITVIFFLFTFNIFKINKENIKVDDSFLEEFFYEGYYPRLSTENKSTKIKLLLGEANKKTYYYELNKLKIENNREELCKLINLQKDPYEKSIIALLKYSKYTHTKTIDYTNKIEIENTLDKNEALNLLKEKYCLSFDKNTTKK